MDIVDWLLSTGAAKIEDIDGRIELLHECGDTSTLWPQYHSTPDWMTGTVRSFYQKYDGADLFSSTFKFGALSEQKEIDGAIIVSDIDSLQRELDGYGFVLPEEAMAFMYHAGIGIYAASRESTQIFQCDTETGEIQVFGTLIEVFEEWYDAVRDDS